MRIALGIGMFCGLALLAFAGAEGGSAQTAPGTAAAGAAHDGAAIFQTHCSFCHNPAQFGAPPMETLKTFTSDFIVEALTTGKMVDNAEGMSPEEKVAVAAYLSGSAGPGTGASPTAPAPSVAPSSPTEPAVPALSH